MFGFPEKDKPVSQVMGSIRDPPELEVFRQEVARQADIRKVVENLTETLNHVSRKVYVSVRIQKEA